MTKQELIENTAAAAKTSKAQAKAAIDSVIDSITKTLKQGGSITLTGFGTFKVSKRGARTGRNPKTGATIEIAARNVARFKASKQLNAELN